jgi:hypothetical protein
VISCAIAASSARFESMLTSRCAQRPDHRDAPLAKAKCGDVQLNFVEGILGRAMYMVRFSNQRSRSTQNARLGDRQRCHLDLPTLK